MTNHIKTKDHTLGFEAYEIHGIAIIDIHGAYEQVDENDAERFELFGHVTGEGLHCMGDFATRAEAERLLDRLTERTSNPLSQQEWQALADVVAYLDLPWHTADDLCFDHRHVLDQLIAAT